MGSIGIDYVISEPSYKGTILQNELQENDHFTQPSGHEFIFLELVCNIVPL